MEFITESNIEYSHKRQSSKDMSNFWEYPMQKRTDDFLKNCKDFPKYLGCNAE